MLTVLHKGGPANDYGSTDYGSLLPEQIQTGQDGYIRGINLSNNVKSSFCNSCYVPWTALSCYMLMLSDQRSQGLRECLAQTFKPTCYEYYFGRQNFLLTLFY